MNSNIKGSDYSPVSVSETMSSFSEVESNISLDENKDASSSPSACLILNHEFTFADGNVELQVSDQMFRVHEYQLNKFSGLVKLIQEARSIKANSTPNGRIRVTCHSNSTDVYNTLRIIYTSVVSGPPKFDTNTLISTLRIATVFNYPELREFAISSLEKSDIMPIDRIQLSDELSLPQWEKPAFTELCQRVEPISISEAQVLGIERLTHIARVRETEQRRQFLNNIIEPLKAQCLPKDVESKLDSEPQDSGVSLSIPDCNCRSSRSMGIIKCSIHGVAPQILGKYNSTLAERDDLLQRLKNLPSIINESIHRISKNETAPDSTLRYSEGGGEQYASIETELSSASWVRHVAKGT